MNLSLTHKTPKCNSSRIVLPQDLDKLVESLDMTSSVTYQSNDGKIQMKAVKITKS